MVERLVSCAAAERGVDPAELRRRNFIPPSAFPYKTPTGSTYEIADLPGLLDKALAVADWRGFAERRMAAQARGMLRGIGIATVIENTSAGMFPTDEIELVAEASGDLTIYSVSQSQGQGHETTLAMIVAQAMDVPVERVRLRQSPVDRTLAGNHSGGSRTAVGAGSVCHLAALKLIEQGKTLAALELDAEPSQVEYAAGAFSVRDRARSVALADLARAQAVSVLAEGSFGATYPNGCHIAEVEIDPDTGASEIVAYHAVDDCGEVINHAIVEGQVHGAVIQGAGQVFGEKVVYDRESGQLLTGSFSDYAMPRAGLVKEIRLTEHPTLSKVSPLGVKGVGESGCTASLPALVTAAIDALRPLGIRHLDMPLTPGRVWDAIRAAGTKL
jgi:carbon-monoxide dehydrogenase large subunit